MENLVCLHLIELLFLISGLQALSFYKFDVETIAINQSKNVLEAMEKKFDDYHALKGL